MAFPRLNNISYLSLIPSIVLFLFAGGIENGVGTGWTLKMDRELLWGDSEAMKLFSMRENPQVLNYLNKTQVIGYSCFLFVTYVKMPMARGQYAWVNKNLYSTHQRLNKEYLENNKNDKTWFEQWLVGYDRRWWYII
jgi:hypothetical protein